MHMKVFFVGASWHIFRHVQQKTGDLKIISIFFQIPCWVSWVKTIVAVFATTSESIFYQLCKRHPPPRSLENLNRGVNEQWFSLCLFVEWLPAKHSYAVSFISLILTLSGFHLEMIFQGESKPAAIVRKRPPDVWNQPTEFWGWSYRLQVGDHHVRIVKKWPCEASGWAAIFKGERNSLIQVWLYFCCFRKRLMKTKMGCRKVATKLNLMVKLFVGVS